MNLKFREKIRVKFDLEPGESLGQALLGVAQITQSAASIQLANLLPERQEAQQMLLEIKQNQLNESLKLLEAKKR